MVNPFCFSPSESLLLGLCLGEYLAYAESGYSPRRGFLEILRSRLLPHEKSFMTIGTWQIAREKCPGGIEWSGLNGIFGISPSEPTKVFVRHQDNKVSVAEFAFPQRSLLDWIVTEVWNHVSKSPYDRLVFAQMNRVPLGRFTKA